MSKSGIAALQAAGRGEDTLLVHMAPKELAALQQMAKQHGGSLTVNPKTGLAEVGFLSSMLPMLAGAATMYFTGSPWGAALAGGATGAVTGDKKKGMLMNAGLGALGGYGGGNIAGGMMNAGAAEGLGALQADALAQAQTLQEAATATQQQQLIQETMKNMPEGYALLDNYAQTLAATSPEASGAEYLTNAGLKPGDWYSGPSESTQALLNRTPMENLQAGAKSYLKSPSQLWTNQNDPTQLGNTAFDRDTAVKNATALAPFIPGLMQPQGIAGAPGAGGKAGAAPQYYDYSQTPLPNSPDLYKQWYSQPRYQMAAGGGVGMANGGIATLPAGHYAAGGKLLQGAGDGVSDSIPATIIGSNGSQQKAALAQGEFVIPARIVSEIGNGSTQSGAKRLYAMMERVQNARRKTKNVAADTKAERMLPA